MKRIPRLLAALTAAALLATACGDAPDTADPGTDPTTPDGTAEPTIPDDGDDVDYLGCLVTDEGGVDDRSFNQTAYDGLVMAERDLGIQQAVLESSSDTDYAPNLQAFLGQGCDMIVSVGFLLAEATEAAAEANPGQKYAIVDFNYTADDGTNIVYDNIRELTFATDEAAFLAGYLAAAMTETGVVGTYGGLPIPTVTIFMDGFLAGVRYHNAQNDTDVQVLGWDGNDGSFAGGFSDQAEGRNITENLLQNGADIIMPVAGPVGLGTGAALQAAGEGVMIWVDTDGFVSVPQFQDLILTSVEKKMDVAVFDTIQGDLEGRYEGGLYVGTLDNGGVDISPFHTFEADVPQEVKDALNQIRAQIIAGELSVDPADHA